MNNTNSNFWQNLAKVGKTILAHVKISFDGPEGTFHIDIIPVDMSKNIIIMQPGVEQEDSPNALMGSTDHTNSEIFTNNCQTDVKNGKEYDLQATPATSTGSCQ